jgi:hypothetical protein
MSVPKNNDVPIEKDNDISDARLNFCIAAFERQRTTVQELEKKSQIFLSFTTVILGAFLLKFEFLKSIIELLSKETIPFYISVIGWVSLAILAFSCFVSLIFLLQSIRLRQFKDGHPTNMIDTLFSPDSRLSSHINKNELLEYIALYYATAVDDNKMPIRKKSNSLKIVHITTIVSLMVLLMFLSVIFYLFSMKL